MPDTPSIEIDVEIVPAGVPADADETDMLAKPVLVLVVV
jgi:hypothetical protein